MSLTNSEWREILADESKTVRGDIDWVVDEEHPGTVEFFVPFDSASGHPLWVKGSINWKIPAVSFVVIHGRAGRIYGLDLGKDHQHDGNRTHKHTWSEAHKDRNTYVPADITASIEDVVGLWDQFCREARITHVGVMRRPPPWQRRLL